MPRDVGSPEAWVRLAKGDLALATLPTPDGIPRELLCFHCQQAAEKAVKAVLVRFGAEPPRTHALAALMASLPERLCPPCPEDVASLTPYATTARYPGEVEPVSRAELAAAVSAATAAVAWAEEVIGGGHDTNGTADPTLRT